MAALNAAAIKELRDKTGAGVMECKRALDEAGGSVVKAAELLRERGIAHVEKVAGRQVSHGLIEAYIHAGGRIGTLVEINCETDFVGRTDEFKALAHDIAMQVAATNPRYLCPEDVPADAPDEERVCLLQQPFIKEPGKTVQDVVNDAIAKLRENIRIRRYTRYELGA